jgi:carbon storage regulator
MLFLTRKVGEVVVINGSIELTVIEVRGRSAKLGFKFPVDASVLRREVFDRIKGENADAASSEMPASKTGAPDVVFRKIGA